MKKPPETIIILHLCTTNDIHIMYGSWNMERDIEFCAISNHFLPFYPTNNLKNQNFEKIKKKAWRYHHFTLVYHKWQSYDVWCIVPET